jgi:hypothetical protein
MGRDSQIEDCSGDLIDLLLSQNGGEVAKVPDREPKSRSEAGGPVRRVQVAIDPQDPDPRQGIEESPGVAPTPEGGIDHESPGHRPQQFDDPPGHHRGVVGGV